MAHKQTQTEWENDMCLQILDVIRSDLYLDFRYLDMAERMFSAIRRELYEGGGPHRIQK